MNELGTAAVLSFALAGSAAAQKTALLSDAQVSAAIERGESGQLKGLTATCSARPSLGETMTATRAGGVQRDGGYSVTVATAAGEIAARAAAAKTLHTSLHVEDVTDDMRVSGIVVVVEPDKPSTTKSSTKISVAGVIQGVVLQSRSKLEPVARPEMVDTELVEVSNLLGANVQGNRAVARFSFDAVRELPARDVDVVVITHEGERRCRVGQKDRAKLFPTLTAR